MPRPAHELIRAAREDPELVLLEGVHTLKHALRFGADICAAFSPDPATVDGLLASLAPDVREAAARLLQPVGEEEWRILAVRPLPSPVLAVATRPHVDGRALWGQVDAGPLVVLHEPRHPGNLGAVVRVAAAAGARGVVVVGEADPWQPAAVRAAAGLHFALPVLRVDALPDGVAWTAVDPEGEAGLDAVEPGAVLAFGGERHGLPPGWRDGASVRVRIPMREGVSSLNLATAVAVVLYTARGQASQAREFVAPRRQIV